MSDVIDYETFLKRQIIKAAKDIPQTTPEQKIDDLNKACNNQIVTYEKIADGLEQGKKLSDFKDDLSRLSVHMHTVESQLDVLMDYLMEVNSGPRWHEKVMGLTDGALLNMKTLNQNIEDIERNFEIHGVEK